MSTLDVVVQVQEECTCTRCGQVNDRKTKKISEEEFDKLAASNPEEYWKELMNDVVVYRHHYADRRFNCRTSCQ